MVAKSFSARSRWARTEDEGLGFMAEEDPKVGRVVVPTAALFLGSVLAEEKKREGVLATV
jgi:hypothetical protein